MFTTMLSMDGVVLGPCTRRSVALCARRSMTLCIARKARLIAHSRTQRCRALQ